MCAPSRTPPPSAPFPYTTLFRSRTAAGGGPGCARCRTRPTTRARRGAGARAAGHGGGQEDGLCEGVTGELPRGGGRSEEHTSELQSLRHLVCRLLLEKKNNSYCP